jgi:predicted component of type VI protein secretion system
VLRVTISEAGQPPLPAVDLDEPRVAIGSAAGARIRLPATAARAQHLEVTAAGWRALADAIVDGAPRERGATGPIGGGVVFELGAYRVRVEPSPAGTAASPPQRTESLARELVRGLLGAGAAPSLQIERGPSNGAIRALPPPEASLVIGRGDEAGWVILDEDLSRAHAAVERGWDGVRIRDLGSKNGTRVGGAAVGPDGAPLHDGARIELGRVVLVFRDPAERHLRGEAEPAPEAPPRLAPPSSAPPARSGRWVAAGALVIAATAIAGLIWILAS